MAPTARRHQPPESHKPPAVPLPKPATIDPVTRRIYEQARRVARGPIGVLITGETGTGKEVLARFIHDNSPRAEQPWVAINCAAVPTDLLEAELFGIEKGVATGVEARPGTFERADGSTLFLDEIGDMSLALQAKILRVLQEGEVYRLGGHSARRARFRLISATHRDPAIMVGEGSFRRDLYHRLADSRFELPPLRERLADVAGLAVHFLAAAAAEQNLQPRGISRAALDALLAFDWPGNIRQLQREMMRAAAFLEHGELLQCRHLQSHLTAGADGAGSDQPPSSLRGRLDRFERGVIIQTLGQHDGNVRAAAEALAIGRTTLYRRLQELDIDLASFDAT